MPVVEIDLERCRACYRCQRECPVHAIDVREGRARVAAERCVACGRCVRECPSGAMQVRGALAKVREMIASGAPVIASALAVGDGWRMNELPNGRQFIGRASAGDGWRTLMPELLRLGFAGVEATAHALPAVWAEYRRLAAERKDFVIASGCPAVVALVERHYPEALERLAPVVSYAEAHARMIKARAAARALTVRVVHIGPEPAVMEELRRADGDMALDAALTLDEVREWMGERARDGRFQVSGFSGKPEVERVRTVGTDEPCEGLNKPSQGYGPQPRAAVPHYGSQPGAAVPQDGPQPGAAVPHTAGAPALHTALRQLEWGRDFLPIYGMDACVDFLEHMPRDLAAGTVVEMAACRRGCALGSQSLLARVPEASALLYPPGSPLAPRADEAEPIPDLSRTFTDRRPPQRAHGEGQIAAGLGRIGMKVPEDALNCAACGYGTCRDLAVAMLEGRAEPELCMPYMRRQAHRVSLILHHTANGVLLVNHRMRIEFANPAFRRMFRCEEGVLRGRPARDVLHSDLFERAAQAGGMLIERGQAPELDLVYRAQTFPIEREPLLAAVIVDISREAKAHREFDLVREATLDRAQEVITRQMKTAQEIAGLLGETTAETKALLVQLMNLARQEHLE